MKKNTAEKAELWADRIRNFQDSGLSHKEWCQKHEIALSTFHYWFRKLQAGSQAEASFDNPVFAKLPSEQNIHSAALLDHTPVTEKEIISLGEVTKNSVYMCIPFFC